MFLTRCNKSGSLLCHVQLSSLFSEDTHSLPLKTVKQVDGFVSSFDESKWSAFAFNCHISPACRAMKSFVSLVVLNLLWSFQFNSQSFVRQLNRSSGHFDYILSRYFRWHRNLLPTHSFKILRRHQPRDREHLEIMNNFLYCNGSPLLPEVMKQEVSQQTVTPSVSVQSSCSFFPIDGAHENNITSDQSSLGSSHGHSLQITEEGAGLREGGRTVEDETEYETVKRRSALLILLFDLRLGSSLIYMTPLRQHIDTIHVYQLSHTLHVYNKYAATRDYLQYANNIFFTSIFSATCTPSVTSYQITVWASVHVLKMHSLCHKTGDLCGQYATFHPWGSVLFAYMHP